MATEAPEASPGIGASADRLARAHFRIASLFLVVAALCGLLLAVQLSAPDFLNSGVFSYGRLQPLFGNAALFGWLTIALIGAIYYVLPRLTGNDLQEEGLALLSLLLLTLSVIAGLVGVAIGESQGLVGFEFPWYVDVGMIAAFAGVTRVVTVSASRHREVHVYISVWFFQAAVWWLLFAYVVGSLGWFKGADLALANRFAAAAVLFLWVLPAGLGLAYYLVPKVTGNPLYSDQLARVSFWSLAGSFAWVGTFSLTFGPGGDFLETITAVFAIAILVPVMATLTVLALSVDWARLPEAGPVKYVLAGLVFFALLAVQIPALAFRSSSSVLQFTTWTEATFVITVLGAGTLWVMGLVRSVQDGRETGSELYLVAGGAGTLVGVLWVGGLLTGFTWASAPPSEEFVNAGEGFVNTTAQLAGFDTLRWVAWVALAGGLVLFAVRTLRRRSWAFDPVLDPSPDTGDPDPTDLTPGRLAFGALLVIGIAFLTTVVLPALDASDEEPSLLAVSARDYEMFKASEASPQAAALLGDLGLDPVRVSQGWELYVSEGCQYCHTQQVRANVTDVGLGAVTQRRDILLESPVVLGVQRLGPDLMHAGSRPFTEDVAWVRDHLADPRADRSWSAMPSYDYLSDDELDALAQYVVSLR